MPTASGNEAAPVPRPQSTNETSPLLRARYSNGYNDLDPANVSPTTGTSSWTRLIAAQPNLESESNESGIKEMPSLMSFISLLPPPREMTYGIMERVLPAGLSPSANGNYVSILYFTCANCFY